MWCEFHLVITGKLNLIVFPIFSVCNRSKQAFSIWCLLKNLIISCTSVIISLIKANSIMDLIRRLILCAKQP